jgi:hypothetical protein
MSHSRRNKICSILVTSRLVGDAARRAFASTALARRDRRLLELSSEYMGIAFGLRLCVILYPADVIASQALAEGHHSRTTPSERCHRANDCRMSGRRDARTACRQMLF